MNALESTAIDWVCRVLKEELHDESAEAETRAINFIAVAKHWQIPIEGLITWLRTPALGKQYSLAEFSRYCEALSIARAAYLQLKEGDEFRKLCPQCYEHAAHRVGSRWRCPQCGELPASEEGASA